MTKKELIEKYNNGLMEIHQIIKNLNPTASESQITTLLTQQSDYRRFIKDLQEMN